MARPVSFASSDFNFGANTATATRPAKAKKAAAFKANKSVFQAGDRIRGSGAASFRKNAGGGS